jgi:hypothetical protein
MLLSTVMCAKPLRHRNVNIKLYINQIYVNTIIRGGSRGGRTRAPPPPEIGKNMIFLRKIVILHTKYPKKFRASLRSAQFF